MRCVIRSPMCLLKAVNHGALSGDPLDRRSKSGYKGSRRLAGEIAYGQPTVADLSSPCGVGFSVMTEEAVELVRGFERSSENLRFRNVVPPGRGL
jgi:hypothetical protein